MKVKILWKGPTKWWSVVSEQNEIVISGFRSYYLAKDWAHEQGLEVLP